MENIKEIPISTQTTITGIEIQSIQVAPTQQPTWLYVPESIDILATIAIGVIGVLARALYERSLPNEKIKIKIVDVITWIFCGLFLGIMGGELSPLIVNLSTSAIAGALGANAPVIDPDSYTWFFSGMMGLLGMPFAIKLFGVVGEKTIDKIESNDLPVIAKTVNTDTMNVYENNSNSPTISTNVVSNGSDATVNAKSTGIPEVSVPVAVLSSDGLTKNFKWIDVGENLPEDIKQKAKWFADNTLQPLRDAFGVPLKINSWYRSPAKNASTPGASLTSFHMTAEAVDIDVLGGKTNKDLLDFMWANKDKLCFDKVIAEHWNGSEYNWIHIQSKPDKQRKEFYIASGTKERPIYTRYLG